MYDEDMFDVNEFVECFYSNREFENAMIDELVTVEEFKDWKDENGIEEWDYPINEYDHIAELHKEFGTEFEAVRFEGGAYGGYEYRFCEVPSDKGGKIYGTN